jgi:2'-5' RNA ligase
MCPGTDSPAGAPWARSFIALAPDAATRAQLAALPALPDARPTHVDDLHLTVAFIGAISDAQRHLLASGLPRLVARMGPMPALAPLGIDAWPSRDRPRVRVALYALPDALAGLVGRVQAALAAADLPIDTRPFRPHITLARFARGAEACATADAPLLHAARLASLGLYCRSDAPGGARYACLACVPLA